MGASARTKSAPPTRAFLEKRVQQLEGSLESKDKECTRKLRALQQKYTALEVQWKNDNISLWGCKYTAIQWNPSILDALRAA